MNKSYYVAYNGKFLECASLEGIKNDVDVSEKEWHDVIEQTIAVYCQFESLHKNGVGLEIKDIRLMKKLKKSISKFRELEEDFMNKFDLDKIIQSYSKIIDIESNQLDTIKVSTNSSHDVDIIVDKL